MTLPYQVALEINDHLEAIQSYFKNSKITLLARSLDAPDGSRDLVMTDDSLDEAIKALEIRRKEQDVRREG